MDICRRIDITARLCDVAQQRNCEDVIPIFQVHLHQRLSHKNPYDWVKSTCLHPSGSHSPISFQPPHQEAERAVTKERGWRRTEHVRERGGRSQRRGVQQHVSQSDKRTDAEDAESPQDESIEKVIKDTESMFKSRDKEYQETIDQIELELATAKSDMNRHLHEYMEMCSMKRGLDVQMETCRRLITQSGDRAVVSC
ncbi:hypothetical protein GOODEAATRI_007112 [Goodea atripinnis]|uniref:IF rod domain-containing protein n=1 Tax=Goodea atripinnis TaxID=208336 RepID=A0ABV0MSY3_9TELE